MIHSASFTALHPALKAAIFAKLRKVLLAEKPVDGFEYLGDDERKVIGEILAATVAGFGE
jgi:hypothetical protein